MTMNALELVTPLTTVLALALAMGMGIALVHLLREERRRSDARVAALMEATALPASEEEAFRLKPEATREEEVKPEATRRKEVKAESTRREVMMAQATRVERARPEAPRGGGMNADPAAASFDLDLRRTPDVAGVSQMFAEPERESPWGRRIAVAAGVAAIVSVAGYVLLSRDTTMDAPAAAIAAQAQPAPLELLSLRHTQQPGSLTVTGLVQNPRSGTALSRITATAFLFSADGTFLASGRAPLDFSTIEPGEESPFVVTVPVTGTVARYRVGFRGEDGRVIAHVDRRASGTMARSGSSVVR